MSVSVTPAVHIGAVHRQPVTDEVAVAIRQQPLTGGNDETVAESTAPLSAAPETGFAAVRFK